MLRMIKICFVIHLILFLPMLWLLFLSDKGTLRNEKPMRSTVISTMNLAMLQELQWVYGIQKIQAS
jgi:hypothetical protein